jgi:type VI secretion system protein ImpK
MAGGLLRAASDFATLVQLVGRAPENALPRAADLRRQFLDLLDGFARTGAADGVSQGEIEEARFALVAWADEVALGARWGGRDDWQRETLQLQLYRTTNAGKEFFEHLERLRPEQGAAREIYFLALALGFQGRYAGLEGERQAVVSHQYSMLRANSRVLELSRERAIAPGAYRLDVELKRRRRLGMVGVLGVCLGIALVIYLGLWGLLALLAPEIPGGGAA